MIEDDEWRAALGALAGGRGAPAVRHREAVALAERLVTMATDGEGERLASLLRPDPRVRAERWRVRQFRLGDIAPTSITDHDDAADAVLTLARPHRDALVAGELLALAADGSGWIALSRNEDEVVVQPPAPDSLLGPGGSPDGFGPLLARWRVALELTTAANGDGGDVWGARIASGSGSTGSGDSTERADPAEDGAGTEEPTAWVTDPPVSGSTVAEGAPAHAAADPPAAGTAGGRARRRRHRAESAGPVAPATGEVPSVAQLAAALASLEGVVGRLAQPVPTVAQLDEEVEDELFERLEELEARLRAIDERLDAAVEAAATATAAAERTSSSLDGVLVHLDALATATATTATAAALADVADRVATTATPADVKDAVEPVATSVQAQAILDRLLELAPAEQVAALLDAMRTRFDELTDKVPSADDLADLTAPLATAEQVRTVAATLEQAATAVQVENLTSRATALQDAISARFAALHDQLARLRDATADPGPMVAELTAALTDLKVTVDRVVETAADHRRAVDASLAGLAGDLAQAVAAVNGRIDDVYDTMARARDLAELATMVDEVATGVGHRVDELHDIVRAAVTDQLGTLRELVDLQTNRPESQPADGTADLARRLDRVEAAMTALARIVEDQVRAAASSGAGPLAARAADALADRLTAVERDLNAVTKRLVTTDRLANASDGLRASLTTFVASQLAELRAAVPSRADIERLSEELRALADRLPAPRPAARR